MHFYFADLPSFSNEEFSFLYGPLTGHRQITDFYLIMLARRVPPIASIVVSIVPDG